MVKNMTEGSPFRLILGFALPLLAGNLFQQTYNLADAAIVGRYLGAKSLAAVGASSSVQFLVLGFCIGICCGFAIPVTQRFGAKDYTQMRRYIFQSAILTAAFGVVLTVACALLCPQILHLLATPENIYTDAYHYLLIIFLGIPFTLLYNILAAILRGAGDSTTPFLFLIVSTFLNIILDCLCIIVFHWGCAGAAAATITAQGISGLLCLYLIYRRFDILKPGRNECRIYGKEVCRLLWTGIPMGLQYSITAIGSMVMQAANNGLGSVYVSGFTAGMRIKQFTLCPFDAIATAVSNFCSQNLGAGRFDRIRKGVKEGIIIGVSYGVLAGIALIFGGGLFSQLFISRKETEVIAVSAKYLRCLGCFYWVIALLNVTRMTTQGLGFSVRCIAAGFIEMAARIIVSLVFVPVYGFTAICFADQSAWISAAMYTLPTLFLCIRKLEKGRGSNDFT